jgi:hypothetical protein
MGRLDSEKVAFFAKENAKVIEYLILNGHEPLLIDSSKLHYHVIYLNFNLDLKVKIDYFIDCLNGQIIIDNFQIVFNCDSFNDFLELYRQCVEIASLVKESGINKNFFISPKSSFLYTKNELVCTEASLSNINASISFILLFDKKINFLITKVSYFGNPDNLSDELKFNHIIQAYPAWKNLFNNNQIYSLPQTDFFPSKMIVGTKILSIREALSNQ